MVRALALVFHLALQTTVVLSFVHLSPGRLTTRRSPRQVSLAATVEEVETSAPLTPVPGKSMLKARAVGVGAATPTQIISNADIAAMGLDTSDEWIASRTGISNRKVLDTSPFGLRTLASQAAAEALEHAGVDASEVDLVIVATSTPDDLFGDATSVAHSIGASNAVAFDLTAACSGFLFGLVTGSQFLETGAYKTAVVVGADALSRWVDWDDRNVCILFGDGAGSVVLQSSPPSGDSSVGSSSSSSSSVGSMGGSGLLGFALHSNGGDYSKLCLPYKPLKRALSTGGEHEVSVGQYEQVTMEGKDVYTFATRKVPEVLKEALANAGMEDASEVDWLLLHQANIRIMETVAKRLGMPMEKVLTNLSEHGNTSAGSIPIALNEAVKSGKVKKGDIIACAGFGAGLSWGACIIKWG